MLYIHYVYAGNHRAFSHMMSSLGPAVGGATLPPLTAIKWHLMEAIHAHMVRASGADCLAAVKKGLELSRRTGMRVLEPLLLTVGAYGALTSEKFEAMDALVSELAPLTAGFGDFDKGNFYCCLLNRDLHRHDIPAAREHGRRMVEAFQRPRAPIPLFLGHAGYAQSRGG
jgi:hypothetical protein